MRRRNGLWRWNGCGRAGEDVKGWMTLNGLSLVGRETEGKNDKERQCTGLDKQGHMLIKWESDR